MWTQLGNYLWGPGIPILVGQWYFILCCGQSLWYALSHSAPGNPQNQQENPLSYPQVIRVPPEDLLHLGAGFTHLAGSTAVSRVVGSIDGCLVRVKPPTENAACYMNKKHSVQFSFRLALTAQFIDVFIGFPWSAHDCKGIKAHPHLLPTEILGKLATLTVSWPFTDSLSTAYPGSL